MDKDSYMLIEQPKYGCSFTEAIKRFYKKYAVFRGRASRSEYWFVSLFYFLVDLAAMVLYAIATVIPPLAVIICIAYLLFCLASIVPSFALYARRLHDANMSAWFILIRVLPTIGYILIINSVYDQLSLGSSSSSSMTSFDSVIMIIFNFIIIPSIITFIFALLPSQPDGARFDRNMQSMPASTALAQQSQYPVQQSPYPAMSNNVNAGSANNIANNTNGRLMHAQRPTGFNYAQSAQQQSPYQSQSAYQSAMQYPQQPVNQQSAYYQQPYGMQAVQAPMPTGYQAPQQYQQYQTTQQQSVSSNDDDYLGYVVEQSQSNPNMPKRSHYGATGNAGSVNMNSFDDTDIKLDNGGNVNNANNAR